MIGWVILALLVAAAIAAFWLLRLRGAMLQFAAAALLLGCAGYALQGRPSLPGASPELSADANPVPLTRMRHAFFGNFTAAERWLLMSEALARRGNTADAAGLLSNAVQRNPNDPQLWVGLGNALVDHAGVVTPASEFAYRRAAELSPGYPAPPFFFGLALLRSGEPAMALALWRDVLANAPAEASWRPLVEDSVAMLEAAARPAQSPQPAG